nr:hypothetical protein [Stygiolobus caldivivus]
MKINPFFYVFAFFNFTIFLPIVIAGLRVYVLWYSPLADTGQSTFLDPFLLFILSYLIVSVIVGYVIFRLKKGRFILVSGPMRIRNVVKATLKDKFGRYMVLSFLIGYFLSFLIVSGLWLLPNVNVSSYFICLTVETYQGSGIQVYPLPFFGSYFAMNEWLVVLGVVNDMVLAVALTLGYYIMSLIYVSLNAFEWKVPSGFRLALTNNVGGFLTASVPALGTIAGICCLTPTAVNSLLFLISSSYPAVTKGLLWKYGTFILGAWTGGILQAILLSSPVILGMILIGISAFEVYKISNMIANKVRL